MAISEIAKTLFAQRLKNTTQPFFPNAAKDLFGAVLTHFSRNQDSFYCDNQALRQFMDAMPTAQPATFMMIPPGKPRAYCQSCSNRFGSCSLATSKSGGVSLCGNWCGKRAAG